MKIVAAVSIMASLVGCTQSTPSIETRQTVRELENMNLYIDKRTGCQYLGTYAGAITPRMDSNGRQVCD